MMKLSTGVVLTAIGTIIIIVVANILATEYRIYREKEEKKLARLDELKEKRCICESE